MAQLNRFNGNVAPFGSNATSGERWVFGSQGATVSDNIDDNLNASFLQGWEAGLDVDGFPTSQDFNAQQYTTSLLVSYLFQTGIAEWNNLQEYYTNSIAVGSNGNIYQSLTDNNIGNNPTTDAVNWISFASKYTLDINGLTEKVAPVDNDILVIEDSADSFNKKKVKISAVGGREVASTAEAQNGINNEKVITPLRLRDGLNASGNADIFAARMWIYFNGSGTVTINDSGNVSSLVDNGTGDYTINLINSLPSLNLSSFTSANNGSDVSQWVNTAVITSSTSVRYYNETASGATRTDATKAFAAIIG